VIKQNGAYRSAEKELSMTRKIILLPLLAVAMVNFVEGTPQKKVEIVKYPLPGSEDTVGEVESKEARKVLDDFYQSKVILEGTQAAKKNDADQLVQLTERFGKGERLTKTQVLSDTESGNMHGYKTIHDHIRMVAFSGDAVVLSGRSTSTVGYGGKVFNGPRVFLEVWVKQDGRWQNAVHCVADAPNGVTRGFE
jgi:hypothetical protein